MSAAAATAHTDRPGVAVCCRAVRQQPNPGFAGGDIALSVRRVVFIRTAADTGRVDDIGLLAKVLGDGESGHATTLTGIVDRVYIAPAQARIFERSSSTFGLDL